VRKAGDSDRAENYPPNCPLRRVFLVLKLKFGTKNICAVIKELDTPREAGGLMSWAASKAVGPLV